MMLVVIAQTDSISKNSSSIVEINTGITLVIPMAMLPVNVRTRLHLLNGTILNLSSACEIKRSG